MRNNMKDKIKKLIPGRKKKEENPLKRQTVEENREIVLEQGRKFKYPVQYSKHKVLINALIVGVVVIALFLVFSWWMLYRVQTLGDFFYTATRIIPIPVAMVDGEPVRYGDFMRRMRASVFYLENQENRDFNSENGLIELNYTRRFNMNEAQRVAFATRIAREQGFSISREEVDANIEQTLIAGDGVKISQRAYEASLWRYYGWTMDDYREIVRQNLLVRKASFAIDDGAKDRINALKKQLNDGADFAELAGQASQDEATKGNGGDAGTFKFTDLDTNGLISVARQMNIGDISQPIQGVDAWYIIKLTEKSETAVRFSQIKINLTELNKRLEQMRADGLIREFIEITEQE